MYVRQRICVKITRRLYCCLIFLILPANPSLTFAQSTQASLKTVTFEVNVLPILQANCVQCHGQTVNGDHIADGNARLDGDAGDPVVTAPRTTCIGCRPHDDLEGLQARRTGYCCGGRGDLSPAARIQSGPQAASVPISGEPWRVGPTRDAHESRNEAVITVAMDRWRKAYRRHAHTTRRHRS